MVKRKGNYFYQVLRNTNAANHRRKTYCPTRKCVVIDITEDTDITPSARFRCILHKMWY